MEWDFEIRDRARSGVVCNFVADNVKRSDSSVSVSRGKKSDGDENHAAEDLPPCELASLQIILIDIIVVV